MSSQLEKTGD